MSGFDSNPFAGPVEVNPFQDPSVTQATGNGIDSIEEYNPFSARALDDLSGTTIPVSASTQPAVLQPTVVPSPQAKAAAAAQAELLKQQAELERKAAELDRKEQELQNRDSPRDRVNNWPPLPRFSPIKPCFYQDFNEIPLEYQRVCKMMYYLWMFHCATLFLNLLACLACFTVSSQSAIEFGLSIVWFILFSPAAFVCWYRPVYKAFRSDSSFNFFFFFFIFAFQVVVYIIQCVGIPKWGNSGWINAIAMLRTHVTVAVFMLVVAGFFTVNAALAVILLKMVHSKYRRTGASFQKAQEELSQGVISNRSFQSAAATAATSAVRGSFQ